MSIRTFVERVPVSEDPAMNLQKELHHKSEDIDDPVLLDVVKVLRPKGTNGQPRLRCAIHRRLQH